LLFVRSSGWQKGARFPLSVVLFSFVSPLDIFLEGRMISELSIVLIPIEAGTTCCLFPFLTKNVMTFWACGAVFAGY
jgi:hypothetical protein